MRNLGLGDSFGNLEDLGLDLTVEKTTSLYGERTAEKHAYLYGGTEEKNVYKSKSNDVHTNYLTDTGMSPPPKTVITPSPHRIDVIERTMYSLKS